jgi:hypothetical protein
MTYPPLCTIIEAYRCGHQIEVQAPTYEEANTLRLKQRREHACDG